MASSNPDKIFVSVRQDWGAFDNYEVLVTGYVRPASDDAQMCEAHISFGAPGSRYRRLPPTMFLHHDQLQTLLDDLWGLGFRPSRVSPVQNEADALRGHLEDMRQIAFACLGVEKP